MTAAEPLLRCRGVGRSYGPHVALRPTDLDVLPGRALALVGPNGAGKSTLVSLLAGALEPSAGRVERRDGVRVGWAPQRQAHYARLTARENLELFGSLEGVPEPRAAADRLLDVFGLAGEERQAGELSAGNRQRLNLALALLGDPDVLLLDEPTSALDPRRRRRLWEAAARVTATGGAVVFATQNLDEVEPRADRVAALLDGALVFNGPVEEWERSRSADLFFA